MKKTTPSSSIYTKLIQKACKCTAQEASAIEESMRGQYGTLDALTLPVFERAAKRHQKSTAEVDSLLARHGGSALQALEALRQSMGAR